MLIERIEGKWIAMYVRALKLCGIGAGDAVAILSETQSRQVNVQLAELALFELGARAFHVCLPTPPLQDPVAVRSTGSSAAIDGLQPVVAALSQTHTVIDCTVEGLLHTQELPAILAHGSRLFRISNYHPEVLERLQPSADLQPAVDEAKRQLGQARRMTVSSDVGTQLEFDVAGAPVRGSAGFVIQPGQVAYWPGGLVLCFPKAGTVNGTLVLDEGDINLTFKRYLQRPVTLRIENDRVIDILGDGLDADLLRTYYGAWNDVNAYGVSHVGWGLNPAARWDSLVMYDKAQINGTEFRAFAGSFLFSTGANEHAGRFTRGHFDFPMRRCTISLDGVDVVRAGQLVPAKGAQP